jgi:pimeloyl-ACP methyl ester carboxylesterase
MSYEFHLGGSGEPLVLLHGFTDTCRTWTPILPMLERHHTVFAPTLPGHFGGEPFAPGTRISIPTSLDMIERQLDAQGIERAHFAGSSLGGWLALELAGRGRALSVVGLCPAGCWERGPAPRRILLYFRRNDVLFKIGLPLGLLPLVASRPRTRALALREIIARPAGVNALAAYTMFYGAAKCEVAPDAIRLAASGDMFGDLPAIDCPVRIAYGTRDWLIRWPAQYTMIQRQMPEADYVALEGVGHLAMWDDPELAARTILEVTAPDRVAELAVA